MYASGKSALFSLLLLLLTSTVAYSQRELVFEFCTGVPYNVPLPLTIYQSGQPDISITAHYYSEPFVVPISWVWRIGYWSENCAWEFEANHHKMFLENLPQEVQVFSISHGLNVLTINRAWCLDSYVLRVGAGIGLAHPENVVRGKILAEDRGILGLGYYVGGPAISVSAGKRLTLSGGLFFILEGKLFGSYSYTPIADGNADVVGLTLQATFGLGYRMGL